MPREIKESDWKLFRQLHPVALERFSQRILSEIGSINADSAKSFHQRYLDIFEGIGRRDREMSQLFDDLRRSTALTQIALRRPAMAEEYLLYQRRDHLVVLHTMNIRFQRLVGGRGLKLSEVWH